MKSVVMAEIVNLVMMMILHIMMKYVFVCHENEHFLPLRQGVFWVVSKTFWQVNNVMDVQWDPRG